ncbi:hypothetical protein CBS101457_000896 [Exobasidium rhododendri]|nr:hypothetical protein CBS101457_000896 [Exobasidium rhododendri]
MAPALSARKAELLRRLATREAIRRQHLSTAEQARDGSPFERGGPSSVTVSDLDAVDEEDRHLEHLLHEERNKNDVEWEKVHRKLASLETTSSQHSDAATSSLTAKEVELSMLEHEIHKLSEDLPRLQPAQNDFVLSLLTRSLVAISIEQTEEGIISKRNDLQKEQNLLRQDEETWRQIRNVQKGLELRREKLRRKRDQREDPESVIVSLKRDAVALESSTKSLMATLMLFCDNLFEEDKEISDVKARRGYQLRHLIDVLVNRAYDRPDDAWVDISQYYSPAIVTLLVRANVAIEHPRDGRTLRLVDFSR